MGFTEPCGAPDLSRFRLVEMFSSCTDEEVKTQIVSLSARSIAFGMGLDCPDVKQVIHLGAPNNIEWRQAGLAEMEIQQWPHFW